MMRRRNRPARHVGRLAHRAQAFASA
jgi:hypothetical protein